MNKYISWTLVLLPIVFFVHLSWVYFTDGPAFVEMAVLTVLVSLCCNKVLRMNDE